MTPTEFFNQATFVPPVQQPHQVNSFSQPNNQNNQNFNPQPTTTVPLLSIKQQSKTDSQLEANT